MPRSRRTSSVSREARRPNLSSSLQSMLEMVDSINDSLARDRENLETMTESTNRVIEMLGEAELMSSGPTTGRPTATTLPSESIMRNQTIELSEFQRLFPKI